MPLQRLPSVPELIEGPSNSEILGANSRRRRPPRRIFGKYLRLFAAVITAAVLLSGILAIWFASREQTQSLETLQQLQARRAAEQIRQFIAEIEGQLGWTSNLPWSDRDVMEQRHFDALRLLRQVPAITELSLLDPSGREQLHVSRLAMDLVGGGRDLSADPKFTEAVAMGVYFGPVYYRRESEPYMTISVVGARPDNGVAVAEVNLIFLWDLISTVEVGETGYAYVVDTDGRLIAHPNNSLVLRNTSFSELPQVAAVLAGSIQGSVRGHDRAGSPVISAFAPIPRLGWIVFSELPVSEALAPIYRSVIRTGGLLLVGVTLAVLLAIIFTRRMVGPINALRTGAERIGAGDLGHRIDVRTGDELEALADQFNDMAGRLQESYAGLEGRVSERTAELEEKGRLLALASAHKSQFVANMSHELRTPLNAILGFTELLLDGIYGTLSAKTRQVVERLRANGTHLLGLINDVLDLSKIEAGQLTLSLAEYNLAAVVRSVTSAMEPLAHAKQLQLTSSIPGELSIGYGDERRLRQVLLNLVGNAIKFTDSGSVEIVVCETGDSFDVAITDSGPGIADADKERIFDEFQQADSSSTRARGGTGLGLTISRRIVELHGGHIFLSSSIGKGATFRIVLPVMAKPAMAEVA